MPHPSGTIDPLRPRSEASKKHLTFDKLTSSVKGQVSSVRKSKGFTLIELLVVIVIIGTLTSVGLASFNNAQAKSRDARRKGDLVNIQKALTLMQRDTSSKNYTGCETGTSCTLSRTSTNPDMTTTYLSDIPTDPSTSTPYNYNPSCTGASCATSYILSADLENDD